MTPLLLPRVKNPTTNNKQTKIIRSLNIHDPKQSQWEKETLFFIHLCFEQRTLMYVDSIYHYQYTCITTIVRKESSSLLAQNSTENRSRTISEITSSDRNNKSTIHYQILVSLKTYIQKGENSIVLNFNWLKHTQNAFKCLWLLCTELHKSVKRSAIQPTNLLKKNQWSQNTTIHSTSKKNLLQSWPSHRVFFVFCE